MIFYPTTFPVPDARAIQEAAAAMPEEDRAAFELQQQRIARGREGERLIFETLQKLNENWIVFHSFRLISSPQNTNRDYDREIDFLILVPGRGLICLEVKNYSYAHTYYNDEDGQPPIEQADKGKWEIVNWLKDIKKIDIGRFEHTRGALMVGAASDEQRRDRQYLCSREKCTDPEALRRFILGRFVIGIGASRDVIAELHQIFKKTKIYKVSLQDYDFVMQQATASIGRLLPMLEASSYGVNVTGCAGSGKTVMAMQEACRLAAAGKKVLYLCYNKNLGIWLRHSKEAKALDKEANLTIKHIHKFCSDILRTNVYLKDLSDVEVDHIQLELMCDENLQYDYVFVDEAQDFLKNYWKVVWYAKKDDGRIYTFSDDEQKLRETKTSIISLPTKIALKTNLRNSKEIAEYGSSILQNSAIKALELKTQNVEILDAAGDAQQRAKKVESVIRDLLNPQKMPFPVSKNQIVVLSPWQVNNKNDYCSFNYLPQEQYCVPKEGASLSAVETRFESTIFNDKANKILSETVKGFKGLEADFVILTDMPSPSEELQTGFSFADFYVACSRAKYGLYIIPMTEEAYSVAHEYLPHVQRKR